ncbi:SDR family oxidoreductase [Novosphingobium album (ex Liu et al. 2023)]|uniref:SDR family oxidoreductase n=1 Tax=Novosphingobium album (ex Liu et al. 2023) TaxID=3031130 RepID=A0ABT5WLG9_9SPHN|nr:SDR family oxidoreductase [Novosphingobium album (ex Liu et al. 2023)]MDE8650882.1 SDR family oxidoreductase [Novosphingobium album (ex Liu et al. 2023)]
MGGKVLEGKVALVTGAGRGIGREIALRLARDGATVIVHYAQSRAGAEEVVAEIAAMGGTAVAYQADIARREEVKALFARIDAHPGRLDIVVNNAGVSAGGALADVTDEDIAAIFGINVFGPLYVASEAASRLADNGRVVNFSSTVATHPLAGAGLYSAAKKAVESFTESWARELGARGITVNTVVPGATSPGMADRTPEYHGYFANASPFKRIGRAEEIVAVVAFLVSPEASWVSGTHILANGAGNT